MRHGCVRVFPIISNPYGAANGAQLGFEPSAHGTFGCGCATPDVAAGNPLVGSGSARVMQPGIKFTFLYRATYQDLRILMGWFSGRLPPL